jgi:hypothetical protein
VLSTGFAPGVFEFIQLLVVQYTVPALGEVTQFNGAYAYSLQGEQGEPHGDASSPYYAITALVDGQVEGSFFVGATPEAGELRGKHLTVFELWTTRQRCEAVFGNGVFEGQLVLLLYPARRVGDLVCKVTIVGEEEQAGSVGVEAPDGDEARHVFGYEFGDGRASPVVLEGR